MDRGVLAEKPKFLLQQYVCTFSVNFNKHLFHKRRLFF
jgi:hypothetical protein